MPKSTAQSCSQCGADLAAATASGLCPRCLLGIGLDDAAGPDPLLMHPGAAARASSYGPGRLPAETSGTTAKAKSAADSGMAAESQSGRSFGDYELVEELGRGGMGIVYKARQRSLNRVLAVKLLLAGQFAGPQSVQRFRGEASAAAVLRHPNIVAIHEIGLQADQHFFSMDYVEGQSLAQLVRSRPLPAKKAAHYLKLLAEAIDYAHSQGILHRDLKPSNVLVDAATDQPRITDFGLAKRLDGESSLTVTGQVLGSPNFMPPEQASPGHGKVGRHSDVYGLGAILYHLLTARAPFVAQSLPALVTEVVNTEPISPRLLNPGVPPDLETVCLKCLEKEPSRRYSTAKELADELGRFLNDEPIQARPITRVERAWRWCRRNPALAILGGGVLVLTILLAAGAPIAAFRIDRERQRAEVEAYTADMNVALQAWKDGNLKRSQDLLRAHIPKPGQRDLRGFEWRYLWKLCQDESLHTIQCSTNDLVWRLASSVAHIFVAASGEKAVKLLDATTGRELQSFAYPNPQAKQTWPGPLIALASGATNLLAAQCSEGVVGLWDLAGKALLTTLRPLSNNLAALALSPDGKRLAAGDGRTLTVWDISRPTAPCPLWSLETYPLFGPELLKFSPDSHTLVANVKPAMEGILGAWNVETGVELGPFPKRTIGFVIDVAFSPDGTLLAASGVQSRIDLWDFTNRTVRFSFEGHLGHINSLAFSPDGSRLISAGNDGAIRVWDIPSQKGVGMLRDPQEREVLSVAFAPDGKSILSTTGDELKLWSPQPRAPAAVIQTGQHWGWPAASPDGRWLVTIGATAPDALHTLRKAATDFSQSEAAKVWDVASQQQKIYLLHPNQQPLPAVFSPDGKLFAVGGEDASRAVSVWETALWDGATGPLKPNVSFTNEFEVGSITFSPDGRIMALAGMLFNPETRSHATNRLAFREVGSWRKLNILERAGAGATERAAAATAAFSKDGRLLAIGYRDGWVRLWDFKRQRLIKELKVHDDDHFGMGVSFSADRHWLASVSVGGPPKVVVFDLTDLEHIRPVLTTKAHAGNSWSAIFTTDSRTLITSGGDGLIKFWNLATLKIAMTLEESPGLGSFLSLSADGNLLVSQDADGMVKLWPAASLPQIRQAERQ